MRIIVLLFIRLHYFLMSIGIKIHGLGYVQRLLKKEFVFKSNGSKYYYLPSIEGSYDYLLIGKSNEPETQKFLSKVLPNLDITNFIDVGASVGEFVFSTCRYSNVKRVFAVEPRPECAYVLRKNAELNNEKRIVVFENAASNIEGNIVFYQNPGGTSSGMYNPTNHDDTKMNIQAITLDAVLPEILENPIMLVDVEGAEPLVLKGCIIFIHKNNPLIIFEYNQTSKKHFDIVDIKNIIGQNYEIYRLRGDSDLDLDFSNSWNCVAIPRLSVFSEILKGSIKYHD